jgi:hypothetical protein
VHNTGDPALWADVIESTRRGDGLTVRVRFRNTGEKPVTLNLASAGQHDSNYITAAETKYPGHATATTTW